MFGKSLSEYIGFQKVFLGLIAVVGLARLGLSLAGLPNETVRLFAMTVVALAGIVYYGVAVHTRGFGSYKQIFPLVLIQNVVANTIAILGIGLSMAGLENIFAASEYSGPFVKMQWAHMLGHVIVGMGVLSLLGWGVGSLIMLVTKKVAARPAAA